ncbi:MAG: carboxypeptidase-like regulatory domain-containing protein [Acidobacteria bacterium]|nr:carboxypeptidase-like regulatory domain-containing protein [Acidobacteriota bacterium]
MTKLTGHMRTNPSLLLLVLVGAAPTLGAAQEQTIQIIRSGPGEGMQMPGMGPRQVKAGTGRIKGQVAATDTGAPIRRAQVRVSGPDIGMKTAMTDAEGRYEFRDLPAGRFTLMASKSGYVNVQYGQTRPFESGRPIELADKQMLDKADISMPRGSVISGRIVDEFGEPLADVMVNAMRQTWAGGRRRLVPAGGRIAQTNDLGQFRMYGLPPGEYYVTATLRGVETLMMDMNVGPGGPVGSAPASGYAPTYFPGTTSGAEAQRITLAVGQEVPNTEFALTPVKLARITGTVVNSEGKPVEGAMISAVPASRGTDLGMFMMGGGTRSSKDGAFTLTGVTPGDYTLQARSVQTITSGDGDRMDLDTVRGFRRPADGRRRRRTAQAGRLVRAQGTRRCEAHSRGRPSAGLDAQVGQHEWSGRHRHRCDVQER